MARKCRHADSYEIVAYRTIRGLAVLATLGEVLARFIWLGHAGRACDTDRDKQGAVLSGPGGASESSERSSG